MIPNPWILLGVGVLWIASLFGVGAWQRDDGATAERVAWQAKEAAALRQWNETIDRLNREARAKEAEHATELAALGDRYAKDVDALDARRRRDLVDARAGALRLRDPAARAPACPGAPAAPATAPAAGDAPAPGELSGPAASFLLELANDADAVARQLAAAQDVIRAQVRACNPEGGPQ